MKKPLNRGYWVPEGLNGAETSPQPALHELTVVSLHWVMKNLYLLSHWYCSGYYALPKLVKPKKEENKEDKPLWTSVIAGLKKREEFTVFPKTNGSGLYDWFTLWIRTFCVSNLSAKCGLFIQWNLLSSGPYLYGAEQMHLKNGALSTLVLRKQNRQAAGSVIERCWKCPLYPSYTQCLKLLITAFVKEI